jgi:hypothetical protein
MQMLSLQPSQQGFLKLLRNDRLADVLVHAGGEAGFAIFVEGIGGHGESRGGLVQGILTDGSGGLHTVQHRHLHIHENQRVAVQAGKCERLLAVLGQIDNEADIFQQKTLYILHDRLVFGDHHARAGELRLQSFSAVQTWKLGADATASGARLLRVTTNQKVLPLPGVLSTPISPSVISRHPVPLQ